MGPIFTPKANTMFGTTQKVNAGEKYTLNTEIQAVNGLNHIDVYSEGKIIASKDFNNTQDAVNYTLDVKPTKTHGIVLLQLMEKVTMQLQILFG